MAKKKEKWLNIHINGKLKFEGLYSNENKNGKGKKYYFDGILKYEGEYLGKRNGNGKEYYKDGKLKFEGQYFKRNRGNGNLKEYYNNGNFV